MPIFLWLELIIRLRIIPPNKIGGASGSHRVIVQRAFSMKKITIIYISPGPVYNSESTIFQQKFIALSKYCKGYFFSTAHSDEERKMGNFTYYAMGRKKNFVPLRFLKYCIAKAFEIRRSGVSVDCVVSYDPLTTGIIGWIVKLILKAKLIVEVNGVYTSPVVWEKDTLDGFNSIKKMMVPTLMKFVFSVSDGISLLFPTQIKQFSKFVQGKTIASYPCWVPVSFFKNLGEKKEVLFVGFPFKIKGVDILIKAFKNIASEFPEWKLKIIGWYPNKEELEKEIDGHPQIYHHKPVSYAEMPKHIGRCGILVLPSRTEAMGRVLVEAAAAGKSRIGSNVDGVSTVINNNVDGLLFESENVSDLEKKMALLISNSEMRKTIGQAALERASIDFSEEKFVKKTVGFLQKVICE